MAGYHRYKTLCCHVINTYIISYTLLALTSQYQFPNCSNHRFNHIRWYQSSPIKYKITCQLCGLCILSTNAVLLLMRTMPRTLNNCGVRKWICKHRVRNGDHFVIALIWSLHVSFQVSCSTLPVVAVLKTMENNAWITISPSSNPACQQKHVQRHVTRMVVIIRLGRASLHCKHYCLWLEQWSHQLCYFPDLFWMSGYRIYIHSRY